MSHRILIVDDDPHIRQVLSFALGKAGMQTAEAADGESALGAIAAQRPDLVVLDINMPRMNGLDVCRKLRAGDDLPILFLSSRDDEIDRVLGLELGGDDYVVKPFSPREVVARVSAILKRGGRALEQAGATPPAQPRPAAARPGGLGGVLGRRDRSPSTVTEFQLLLLLASHPAQVFTRDTIIDRLHGPGFAITDRTIDSHIRNLRAKFAAAGRHRPDRDPRRHRLPDRPLPGRRRLIRAAKAFLKRFWPSLRLRTILFATLLFAAALPGFGAVFLRVYENTLVQQTEAELIAQGAVLASAYRSLLGGRPARRRAAREHRRPSARRSTSTRCRCSAVQPPPSPPAGRSTRARSPSPRRCARSPPTAPAPPSPRSASSTATAAS